MLKYMMNYSIKAIVSSILTFSSNRCVVGSSPTGAAPYITLIASIMKLSYVVLRHRTIKRASLNMPRVAAGLSRWPFKPKYRVQLPDGVPCLLDVVGKKETSQPLTLIRTTLPPALISDMWH